MGLDRYNTQKQRLKKLLKIHKNPSVRMNSKQHKEMYILKSAHNMVEQDYSIETMHKMISYIEDLDKLDRATSSDIARLLVLKDKVLNNG